MNDYQTDRPLRLVTKQQVESESEADGAVLPVCSRCRQPCQTIRVERPTRRLVSGCCKVGLRQTLGEKKVDE